MIQHYVLYGSRYVEYEQISPIQDKKEKGSEYKK